MCVFDKFSSNCLVRSVAQLAATQVTTTLISNFFQCSKCGIVFIAALVILLKKLLTICVCMCIRMFVSMFHAVCHVLHFEMDMPT